MIDSNLHLQPVALDREQHKGLRLKMDNTGLLAAAQRNALFLTVAEFREACHEYPIVFVRAGTNPATGKAEVAPMAVLGLQPGENLMFKDGQWQARYVPAVLRAYPFAMAMVEKDRYVVCVDMKHAGLQAAEGEALFTEQGEPSAFTQGMQQFLEQLEAEVQRTRMAGEELMAADLLSDMRFDAKAPDGRSITVDGFLAVDEKKLAALPDDKVVALHRSGLLGLIQAHLLSLGHLRLLADRRLTSTAAH